MNAQTNPNQPRMSALLAQVAVKVTLTSTSLGLNRLDRQASKEADRAHNAKQGTGKLSVNRLSGAEHKIKQIADCVTLASNELKAITTAFDDGRLLANTMLQRWLGIWGPIKNEHTRLVEEFKADAPRYLAEAEVNKGSYNVALPTMAEINEAFSLDSRMTQIADSASYQGRGLDAAINARMQAQFEDAARAAYAKAEQDALSRVREPVRLLAEGLSKYEQRLIDQDQGKEVGMTGTFRDTLIGNVQKIAEVFDSFNLTGDPMIASVAAKLKAFEGIEPDSLRASGNLRENLTKKAGEILADIADLI